MAASLLSLCQLVVGPPPIFELRRSPPPGGYQGHGVIDLNMVLDKVIQGLMDPWTCFLEERLILFDPYFR